MCITHTWTFEVRGVFVQLEHHKYITIFIKEHDQSIKHMNAINQSKFRESKTFSSLRSLQKVDSFRGLVKISASWFLGANIKYFDISLLLVVSQKVMSDVYVLCTAVFNRIVRHADSTLIIT
jgi:hypothetical protein